MILTITAAYDVWTNDFYQNNEALVYSFGIIVILLLVIMIIISISKSKRLKTLQRINEVAEESNQLKNAFIANMTHEIRTPLNAIVGFTTMLAEMDNLDRETRMAFLKEINDNKDSLLQLVNDLLDYSKIEANTLEYNDGEVDVNALIDEVCTTENITKPLTLKRTRTKLFFAIPFSMSFYLKRSRQFAFTPLCSFLPSAHRVLLYPFPM